MSKELYVPVILGTAREGRQSEKVAQLILKEAEVAGLKTELIDVRDFKQEATGQQLPQAKKYIEKIGKSDGLVIVSPEYNHSFPGELKMMLDMAYQGYARKPVGICGVSGSQMGGVRMVEQLRLICIEFRMVPIREALYFPIVQNLFDEKGNIKDDSYSERIKNYFDELIWYAEALKSAREKNRR